EDVKGTRICFPRCSVGASFRSNPHVPFSRLRLLTLHSRQTCFLPAVVERTTGRGAPVLLIVQNLLSRVKPSSSCFFTSESCCTDSVVRSTTLHQTPYK